MIQTQSWRLFGFCLSLLVYRIFLLENVMMRTFLGTSALLTTLLVAVSAHAQAPAWAKIRIGVEANYPPFSQMSPDGKFSGFDIDIANAICKSSLSARWWPRSGMA
jgi:ABC-type amino acid transport substrate-binding protein